MTSSDATNAIPKGLKARAMAWMGGPVKRRLARWSPLLATIDAYEPEFEQLSDRDLRKRSLSLQFRAKSREPLGNLLCEAYALVREAGRRTVRMRHFEVQMLGGIALFYGSVAEMQTGEGKTLTASLPLYLRALEGKGAHLATVNDYLAKRDADQLAPLYQMLGLSVGVIQTKQNQEDRRKAYGCDITYGTAKEFGFDFLRDRLLLRRLGETQGGLSQFMGGTGDSKNERPVGREAHFCLVDEADSILIDEARTPLIIGTLGDKAAETIRCSFEWAAANAARFEEDEDYDYDHEKRKVELTADGRQKLRSIPQPASMNSVGLIDLYKYVERAIKVEREYIRDRQYVVKDGQEGPEIVIVDEFTGRLGEGRKWRDGIHQAVEAKERITVSMPTGQAARITVQDLFLRYRQLAGMTGTASTSAREIRKIYKIHVIPIPTNRPPHRERLNELVYAHSDEKWQKIVEEVRTLNALGRPVLIGTRSIDKSELLSRMLTEAGITHQVLNAHRIAEEAAIVSCAGEQGKVTVATNMAGRGTDVKLGAGVAEIGGMHVICTELHDSARIDRQLIGRCGRQGDPGSFRQFLSLDDDILKSGLGPKKAEQLAALGARAIGSGAGYSRLFYRAQRRVERDHLRQRMVLLYHEKQRKKMQLEMGQDPYLDTPD